MEVAGSGAGGGRGCSPPYFLLLVSARSFKLGAPKTLGSSSGLFASHHPVFLWGEACGRLNGGPEDTQILISGICDYYFIWQRGFFRCY